MIRHAVLARFRRDVEGVLGRTLATGETLAVAVSGGPDSMALLALAHAAWPGQVIAATVDHGLRPEATLEAAMVAAYCSRARDGDRLQEAHRIPHAILAPASPLGPGNVQATARAARYAVLAEWARAAGATVLATAHHADDQAETFLMRAARGSGVAGLAAIRPRRETAGGLAVIRPLLGWRRAELRDVATACALPFVDDPSNADDHYDRTRFRKLLAAAPWLDPLKMARSAAYLAEADHDLRAVESWLLESRAVAAPPGEYAIDIAGCPREVRRRLARAGLRALGAHAGSPNIEALLDALDSGKRATQAGVMIVPRGTLWHFGPAPPRTAVAARRGG